MTRARDSPQSKEKVIYLSESQTFAPKESPEPKKAPCKIERLGVCMTTVGNPKWGLLPPRTGCCCWFRGFAGPIEITSSKLHSRWIERKPSKCNFQTPSFSPGSGHKEVLHHRIQTIHLKATCPFGCFFANFDLLNFTSKHPGGPILPERMAPVKNKIKHHLRPIRPSSISGCGSKVPKMSCPGKRKPQLPD